MRILALWEIGGFHGAVVTVGGNGLGDLSSNGGKKFAFHSDNTLEKDMHPTILSPAMGK